VCGQRCVSGQTGPEALHFWSKTSSVKPTPGGHKVLLPCTAVTRIISTFVSFAAFLLNRYPAVMLFRLQTQNICYNRGHQSVLYEGQPVGNLLTVTATVCIYRNRKMRVGNIYY